MNKRIEMLKEMVEKIANPVCWIGYQEDRLVSLLQNFQQVNQFLDATNPTGKVVPLYTHPVKELTDAEIRTIQDMCHLKNVGYNTFIMRFARAILRKAQKK